MSESININHKLGSLISETFDAAFIGELGPARLTLLVGIFYSELAEQTHENLLERLTSQLKRDL